MTHLVMACSTVTDGSMKIGQSLNAQTIMKNRELFLAKNSIDLRDTILVPLTYGGDNYRRYFVVDKINKGEGITRDATREADGLLTTTKNLGLFLPLADCIGTVLYDPTNESLMLTHLGRHNLEQEGGKASVEYMIDQCGSSAVDIQAWLSPAAGSDNYPLFTFDNRSMHDVAIEQLLSAGLLLENITTSPVDTTTDSDYFSHSEFLKGNKETDGRFAVIAMMQG